MRTAALAAALVLAAAIACAAAPIGVITELHVKNGQVEVKPAGGDWQRAKPLLSINDGDQLRASGSGRAVLVFAATQHSAVVTPANSPYTAAAPAQPSLGERVKNAVAFLQSTPRESGGKNLTVRSSGAVSPVVLLAPRESLVAAERISLEWTGPETSRYTVRVVTGDGRVVWEKNDVEPRPLTLAPSETRLAPGRYRWEVETARHGIQRAAFDVATPEIVGQARAAADAVEQAGYPAVTTALLKAAGLMRERFHADARRELLRAVAASPEEPTLHALLAELYGTTGLANLAVTEDDLAEALSGGR